MLDNDVSALVARMLRVARHRAIMVSEVGLADASDDQVSVFADDHKGVVLTHDVEFIRRRRRNTFGYHVHLRCAEPDADVILGEHLETVIKYVESRDSIVLKVARDGVTAYRNRWF